KPLSPRERGWGEGPGCCSGWAVSAALAIARAWRVWRGWIVCSGRTLTPGPSPGGRGEQAGYFRIEAAVPIAVQHVRRQHLYAMSAGVGDDLRRGVEAHGLGVDQRAGKGRR